MAASILFAQTGAPVGTAGKARLDFVTGTPVTATVQGGPFLSQLWSFLFKPYNEALTAEAAAAFSAPSSGSTSITPIDLPGEYLVRVVVDSGSGLGATEADVAENLFYAGQVGNAIRGPINLDPAELPQRMPAFRETDEDNYPTLVEVSGNTKGWAYPKLRRQAVLERIYRGKSWAWGHVESAGTAAAAFNAATGRTAVGQYTVTFTRAMPNANYAVLFGVHDTPGGCVALSRTTAGFLVERGDVGGTLVDAPWAFDVRCSP